MSIAALLVPLTAATESGVQSGAPTTAVSATARVNFKIVIPKVLSLQIGQRSERAGSAQTVAIMSNGHNVTLNAAVRSSDAGVLTRGNVVFSAAARKVILQDAQCTPGGSRGTAVVCTVSMP